MTGRRQTTRRARSGWWFVAGAVAAVYLAALGGATALGFAAASGLRTALTSEQFQAALHAARHPITQADLPRLLPGIPVYPGATIDPLFRNVATRPARRGAVRVHLAAPASRSQIRAFYLGHMAGWEFDSKSSGSDRLRFRRGDERCRIAILPNLPLGMGRRGPRRFTIYYFGEKARQP